MPIPPEFQEQEHLQSVIRRWINREIRDYFIDLGGDDWDPDLNSGRANLRYACEHKDTDSLIMTQLRWQLFERIRRSAFDMPIFGVPIPGYQISTKYRPQIALYFQEDIGDTEPGFPPVDGIVRFRLMDYESDTITPPIAQTFAQRIESNFGIGGGFVWRKGRVMCSYTDKARGYKLQILARDDTYARDLINRVLDIQNHTPDWSKLNVSENQNAASAYPPVPPNDYIFGETVRLPRTRPVADVRFKVSYLHIHGLANAKPLYDRTGLYPSALAS